MHTASLLIASLLIVISRLASLPQISVSASIPQLPILAHIMDRSYITHQRRFALIPQGASLSPEDEQTVRMRTGDVIPATSRGNNHDQDPTSEQSFASTTPTRLTQPEENHGTKKRASTTAEEYQAATTGEGEVRTGPQNHSEQKEQSGDSDSGDLDVRMEESQGLFSNVGDLYGQGVKNCGTASLCGPSPKTVAATTVWTS
jgi:hypothetical protein